MDLMSFYVDEEDEQQRLDTYIAKELDELSRSYIQKLIKDNLVYVNNQNVKSSYIIKEGDYITVKLPEPKKIEIVPENMNLDIIYEDESIVIVNKPQGMIVHPAKDNYRSTLVNGLLYHIDSLSSIGGLIRPGIVHRLDKDTSGLLIVAKDDQVHNIIANKIMNRNVNRLYKALVHGEVDKESDVINAPIGRNPANRISMTVIKNNSKEAITNYRILERFNNYTLIEVALETGRMHQIRVHMEYINHPIVGDPVYSNVKNEFGLNKQMLHAYKLGFKHPITEANLEFEAELPKYFKRIVDILKSNRK